MEFHTFMAVNERLLKRLKTMMTSVISCS